MIIIGRIIYAIILEIIALVCLIVAAPYLAARWVFGKGGHF